ncbi:MAG TPA: VWA domain-containing protein [Terriglobia bacterium]|nr:VWA domain-containing protein [Terriglobia bacterium]
MRGLGLFLFGLLQLAGKPGDDALYTVKVDVPVVTVDVSVEDSNGNLVSNLTRDDFLIYENGNSQEIRFFSPVSAPYNVFLLFDRSGSTQSRRDFMRRAIAAFVATLRPQDRTALGYFDDELKVPLRWNADSAKTRAAVNELMESRVSNGTNFYASLERTLRSEFNGTTGRRAVIVLTDGEDTSSFRDVDRVFERALKTARERRIPIYLIAWDEGAYLKDTFPWLKEYFETVRLRMEQFADVSGGQILFPKSFKDVVALYDRIGRQLGTSYSLGYVPSTNGPAGSRRQIEVKTRTSGLRVTQSRTGYDVR